MPPQPTVFVVDDDPAVRDSLALLLRSVGLPCRAYPTAREFLAAYEPSQPGCLLLDVRMPGMGGLELQGLLAGQGITLPVVLITGHADVPMAVRAMKGGAVDFLEKPFNDQVLLDCVHRGLERDAEARRRQAERAGVAQRLGLLTPREREVM